MDNTEMFSSPFGSFCCIIISNNANIQFHFQMRSGEKNVHVLCEVSCCSSTLL